MRLKGAFQIFMLVVPLVCAGLSGNYLLGMTAQGTLSMRTAAIDISCAIAVTGLAGGVLCFIGTVHNMVLESQTRRLKKENLALSRRVQFIDRKSTSLQARVELLTAMREVSHVVNTGMDSERTLTEVIRILEGLVEADEFILFLIDEEDGGLVPRVYKAGTRTLYGDRIDPCLIDDQQVSECLEHRSIFRSMEGEVLSMVMPLIADQEVLGVLKLEITLQGDAMDKEKRLTYLDFIFSDFSKHVAMTIRTLSLHNISVLDVLTGLGTRRHFLKNLQIMMNAARRRHTVFCLVMMDIDKFKSINDTYGHITGDIILAGVAKHLQSILRAYDSAYRYGGEEMCVLLEDSDLQQALAISERIREAIQHHQFVGERGDHIHVTVSMGIAAWDGVLADGEELISRADQALYFSKENGRNQVNTWPLQSTNVPSAT